MQKLTPIPKRIQTQEQKLISQETTAFSETKARTVHPLSEKEQNEKLKAMDTQPRKRENSLDNARRDLPFRTIQRTADQPTKARASERIPDSEKVSESSDLLPNSQADITQTQSSYLSTPFRSANPTKEMTFHQLTNQSTFQFKVFLSKINQLDSKISQLNCHNIVSVTTVITNLLEDTSHLLDQFRQMKLAYPTHSTRERDTQKRIEHRKRSAYEFDKDTQTGIALSLSNMCSRMLSSMHVLLITTNKNENLLALLTEPRMECDHLWLMFTIEAGNSQPNNSFREDALPVVMNSIISDLATADILCRTKDKKELVKLVTLYRQRLSELLLRHNKECPLEHRLNNTMLNNNIYELHLSYAENFIQAVYMDNPREAANALETITLLTSTPSTNAESNHHEKYRNRSEKKEVQNKELLKEKAEKSRTFIGNKEHCKYFRFYPLNAYFNEALHAAHVYFDLQIQAILDPSASFIAVDDLCQLLNNFEQWINDLLFYGLVHETNQDFIRAKSLLEADKQKLNTLHTENEEFIAKYFKSAIENEKQNAESRKTTQNKCKKKAGIAIQKALSHKDTDSETPTEKPIAPHPPKTQPSGAAAAEHETETEKQIKEESDDHWLQVKKGGKTGLSADASLRHISTALHEQNATTVKEHLKLTNLQDACKKIKEIECALTPIISQLLIGYTHAMEMTRRSHQCHCYLGDIAPFIDSLLNHGALSSVKTKDLFVKAAGNMNAAHEEAQRAFSAAVACINTLENAEFKEDELRMAANTACIALINTIESCSTNLITYGSGMETAWKKRYILMKAQAETKESLRQQKPQKPQKPQSNTEDPIKRLRENNKLLKDSQRYLLQSKNQLSQKREENYSDNTPPPPSAENVEILKHRTASAQEKLHRYLQAANLTLDQALTIQTLSYCTPVMTEQTNESDENKSYRFLTSLASTMDIEIVAMDINADAPYTIPRKADNQQREKPPKLADATPHHNTAQPLDKPKDIHSYYHNKMLNILLEINSNEMATSVIMTGSMAYQTHILRHWGEGDLSLRQVYQRHEQAMPEGLTSSQMECIDPRDTDLIVMNNGDINRILAQLKALLEKAKNAHPNQQLASKDRVTIAEPAIFPLNNVTCTSHRIVIHGEGKPPKSLHYSVDIITGIYPNQPTAEQYTTIPFEGNNRLYIRHVEDIIMDELHSIRILARGENKKLQDISRLCLLAALENIQPRLETTSRLALLYALNSLADKDPTIASLADKLRMRPFNIICYDGRLQGASQRHASIR